MARAARLARRAGRHALADELDYAAVALGWQQLHPFPGYTGFPGLASAEAGACFAEIVLDRSVELCRRALAGSPDDDRPADGLGRAAHGLGAGEPVARRSVSDGGSGRQPRQQGAPP